MYTTLISVTDLASNRSQPNWIILDCRHDLNNPNAGHLAYQQGHIPDAQFAHLDQDLSGAKTDVDGHFRGRHPLPDPTAFIQTLRKWSINNTSQVIAYDAQGGMFAARLWWLLRSMGHQSVAVLDGGLPMWEAAQGQLTTDTPHKNLGTFQAQPSLTPIVNAQDVLANITLPSKTLIDARAPDRFRGENETMDPIGGHIPGAKNRFFRENLQENGCFKTPDQLQTEWASFISVPEATIMQCGSGVTACHNLLALEIAGLSGAALYPGSWSEWCANPTHPIAMGH